MGVLFAITGARSAWASLPVEPVVRPGNSSRVALNPRILVEIRAMHRDGAPPYAWTPGEHTDGVSRPVRWREEVLAAPDAGGGVHCSGVTFEVWVRALEAGLGDRPGPSAAELRLLKESWYNRGVRDGGPVDALVQTGLGERVHRLEDLQPGDIVQFWRNNGNGHSAIFIEHTHTRSGAVRGMVFWSAQSSSHGIGRRIVSVGTASHQITPGRLYAARPVVPVSR